MDLSSIPRTIGERFHTSPAQSILACADLCDPIVCSHVIGDAPMRAPTLAPPVQKAFAIHVHHTPLTGADLWIQGRHTRVPRVENGSLLIFDLQSEPISQTHQRFEFSRFQLSRAAMDDLAYERGLRRIGELRSDDLAPDHVAKHLAVALVQHAALTTGRPDPLFVDHIALALFAHVVKTYGGAAAASRPVSELTPWQMRQLEAWVEDHLHESLSIGTLAQIVRSSPSYFVRAFVKSFGVPPHRWLLRRRIELAKRLMRCSDAPLCQVASACGFADQSHFTRVFSRYVKVTPGRWRRSAG